MLPLGLNKVIGKKTRALTGGALLFGCLYLMSPYRFGVVWGDSMTPSMQSGLPFLIDRLAYRHAAPRRGDVVVFVREGVTYIKRVAAVEGDRFHLLMYNQGGDDRPLHGWEASKLQRCFQTGIRPAARLVQRKIPRNCCYVLGDHTMNSIDSRQFGPVTLDQIQGKILFAPVREPDLEMAGTPLPAQP